jgi:hypothetical protein
MAGKQVQRRRGTTAQHTPFIGALGEVTVDTVKMVEVVHDGSTPGGFPQASARDIVQSTADTDAKLALKVSQDSPTGVAKIPKGTTGQRPVTPQVGDFRYNSTTKKFEGYADPTLGWAPVGGDSIPLFSVFWIPKRSGMPAGFVAADGQLLSRATYPDAWAGVNAGNVPKTIESDWLGNAVVRACYTDGDLSTTFRMPDYNGKAAGSWGALFLRGDGVGSRETDGLLQQDQFQSHTHSIIKQNPGAGSGAYPVTVGTGQTTAPNTVNGLVDLQTNSSTYLQDSIAGAARVGQDTHPLNATGCWAVKLFGAVINPGAADAAQLATEVANIKADMQNNYYRRNNILGAVSQSGGVPTGAVLQYITNANGMCLRMADGTMMTASRQAIPISGWTALAGSGLYYTGKFSALPIPAAFATSPICEMNLFDFSSVSWFSPASVATETLYPQFWIVCAINTAPVTMYVDFLTYGRWY